MRIKRSNLVSFVLILTLLVSSSFLFAEKQKVTILHTNDHHGHFEKFNPYPVSDVGGFAAQSALVNSVRAEVEKEGGEVILLSAGDLNTGIPESDMLDAEPDIKMMNMLGYDAMALGNHEFDNSREVLMKQMKWAEFPFISANTVLKKGGKTLVEPYIVKELKSGLKVGILGLTEPRTAILTLPENVKDLKFLEPVKTAKKYIKKMEKESDMIVALSHLGYYPAEIKQKDDIGDIELAQGTKGIDVIVGGHTHTKMREADVVDGTIIVQAGGYSEYVGRLDLIVDDESGEVEMVDYNLLSVNGKDRISYNKKRYYVYKEKGYVEDKEVLGAIEPYLAKADEKLLAPVGEAVVVLGGAKSEVRGKETNLGNLITDAMMDKTGADIAFQNGGGIRASIEPGKITYRDILTVQPFGNTLTTIEMSGAQVMEVLDFAATIRPGSGAFLHVGGMSWTLNRGSGKAENVKVGGKAINLKKSYTIVTNNFMATGGDGYKMLKGLPNYDTGYVDADALKDYIAKLGKVSPKVEGRLTIVD